MYGLSREAIAERIKALVYKEWAHVKPDTTNNIRIQNDKDCCGVLFDAQYGYATNGMFLARLRIDDRSPETIPIFFSYYDQENPVKDSDPFARFIPDIRDRFNVIFDEWRKYCVRTPIAAVYDWLKSLPCIDYVDRRRKSFVEGYITCDHIGRPYFALKVYEKTSEFSVEEQGFSQFPAWGAEASRPKPESQGGRFVVNAAFLLPSLAALREDYYLCDFRFNDYRADYRQGPLVVAGENFRSGKPQIEFALIQARFDSSQS